MKENKMEINVFFEEISYPDKILKLTDDTYKSIIIYIKNIFHKFKKSNKEINFIFKRTFVKNEPKYPNNSIIIIITKMRDLHEPSTYNFFKNKFSRLINGKFDDNGKVNFDNYCPAPMIMIGLEDITGMFKYYKNEKKSNNITKKKNDYVLNLENIKKDYKKLIDSLNLDKRVLFFDSSIWQRYVPLNDDFEKRFKNTLNEICFYHELGLYKTTVAAEYLEFRTRMMLNSYLAPLENSHARNISPFHFHSETLMRERAKQEFNKINKKAIYWHCLLVDDYTQVKLRKYKNNNINNCIAFNKKEILEKIFKAFDKQLSEKLILNIPCENSKIENSQERIVEKSIEKMKQERYDIIFLDYLLGEKSDSDTTRETAIELLENIQNEYMKDQEGQSDLLKKKGPLGRFWFFPISAFSYAMLDDVREKGFGHHTDLWELSSGADPINTPNLFLYKLLKFMNQQIKDVEHFNPKHLSKINKEQNNTPDLYSFLVEYFGDSYDVDIRKQAKKCYPNFVEMHSKFEVLSKHKDINEKNFRNSILKVYFKGHNESFFEHLQHLIYLLAYGSAVQAPAMWEEFQFIKNKIDKDVLKNKLKSVVNNVSKYIVNLNR